MDVRLLQNHTEQTAAKMLVRLVSLIHQFQPPSAHKSPNGVVAPVKYPIKHPVKQIHSRDSYDVTATWFGVFDGGELCGCLRQCGRMGGCFELEYTQRLPRFLAADPHAVEISQVVVQPDVDAGDVLTALLQFSLDYGRTRGHSYHFATGTYPRPGKLYVDTLGMQLHGTPLASQQINGAPLYLYYLDLRL